MFWVDGGIHSKNGGKTASRVKRMMHKFSLHFSPILPEVSTLANEN